MILCEPSGFGPCDVLATGAQGSLGALMLWGSGPAEQAPFGAAGAVFAPMVAAHCITAPDQSGWRGKRQTPSCRCALECKRGPVQRTPGKPLQCVKPRCWQLFVALGAVNAYDGYAKRGGGGFNAYVLEDFTRCFHALIISAFFFRASAFSSCVPAFSAA